MPNAGTHSLTTETGVNANIANTRGVLVRLLERSRAKLIALGQDPEDAFPTRLVPKITPLRGKRRMCLETVHREIHRGHLEAIKVGRDWWTDLPAVERWLRRRTYPDSEVPVTVAEREAIDTSYAAAALALGPQRGRR